MLDFRCVIIGIFCLFFSGWFSVEVYPQDNYLDLAALFKENGEYEKAINVLTPVCEENADPKIKKYLSKLYYLNGDSKKSLQLLEQIKKKDWYSFLYLGLIYQDLGEVDLAVKFYRKSLRLRQTSIALWRLAKISYYNQDYKEAAKNFSQVISFDSSIRLTHYYLGDCYLKENKFKDAYSYFSKAVNFYPHIEEIKQKLETVKKNIEPDFFEKKKQKKEKAREDKKLLSYRRHENVSLVKVGLGEDLRKVTFKCGGDFLIENNEKSYQAVKNKLYTIMLEDDKFIVCDYDNESVVFQEFKDKSLRILSSQNDKGEFFPFYVLDLVYGEGNFWHKTVDRVYRGDLTALVRGGKITLINILSAQEYVYGVLPSEIPASSHPQALAAQAIAARTIAFRNLGRHKEGGFDFCADVHCQVYQGLSAESVATNKAVDATAGSIITYKDKPIETFYHANCGGCLCSDAFGKKEYLAAKFDCNESWRGCSDVGEVSLYQEEEWFLDIADSFCSERERGKFRWQRVYDKDDFSFVFGFELSDLEDVLFLEKGDCFHYKRMELSAAGESQFLKSGLKIRNYFDKLRSSAFKLEVKLTSQKVPQTLFFWGAGFGHGAGLCQEGAMEQAKQGYSYQQILTHYYPNTEVKGVRP
jgi:SpoIID/LytB domain protein